jgi:hypothetical protein
MTPKQLARMASLQERIADVVLDEADPDNWPGKGKTLAELTTEERGNRYWCKKNAAASFALLARCTVFMSGAVPADPTEEESLDRQIAKREQEAERLLGAAMNRARGGTQR